MIASGWNYWVVTLVGYVAVASMGVAMYVGARCGGALFHVLFRGPFASVPPMWGMPIGVAILIAPLIIYASMYLIHVYAWQLGLLYRLHHDQFDWVWQKHKSERNDTQAQLHAHRQKLLEAQGARARKAMEERQARPPKVPVAKPVDPWRH